MNKYWWVHSFTLPLQHLPAAYQPARIPRSLLFPPSHLLGWLLFSSLLSLHHFLSSLVIFAFSPPPYKFILSLFFCFIFRHLTPVCSVLFFTIFSSGNSLYSPSSFFSKKSLDSHLILYMKNFCNCWTTIWTWTWLWNNNGCIYKHPYVYLGVTKAISENINCNWKTNLTCPFALWISAPFYFCSCFLLQNTVSCFIRLCCIALI